MKNKLWIGISLLLYLLAFILVGYYFFTDFKSPIDRVILLLIICITMYLGGLLLSKNIKPKYKDKPLKINLFIWLVLYVILLSTLTLFDDYFYRNSVSIFKWNQETFRNYINHSFNMIPFLTIGNFIIEFIKGNVSFYSFMYNIFGNLIAFMPFAFLLPLLFPSQQKFKNFFITIVSVAVIVELLQFITQSGSCDIEDVILNSLGACIMFRILQVKSINKIVKKFFLFSS